jgi:hypothetical protein
VITESKIFKKSLGAILEGNKMSLYIDKILPREMPDFEMDIAKLSEQFLRSTPVSAWRASPDATVRGPYNRWFQVTDVPEQFQRLVAHPVRDATYAAAAMNAVPHLINYISKLESDLLKYRTAQK